jgi:hypothetical protein
VPRPGRAGAASGAASHGVEIRARVRAVPRPGPREAAACGPSPAGFRRGAAGRLPSSGVMASTPTWPARPIRRQTPLPTHDAPLSDDCAKNTSTHTTGQSHDSASNDHRPSCESGSVPEGRVGRVLPAGSIRPSRPSARRRTAQPSVIPFYPGTQRRPNEQVALALWEAVANVPAGPFKLYAGWARRPGRAVPRPRSR